jgi:hypothetical protein
MRAGGQAKRAATTGRRMGPRVMEMDSNARGRASQRSEMCKQDFTLRPELAPSLAADPGSP